MAGDANGISQDQDRSPASPPVHANPDNCRSCTSFAAWTTKLKSGATDDTASRTALPVAPTDCPPDVEELGRGAWTVLHSVAAAYPERAKADQKADLVAFLGAFSRLYPCWHCGEDFRQYIARPQTLPRVEGRAEFGTWLCDAHNHVNRRLGKPMFDCMRWEERWRSGWRDGRCS